MLGAQTKVLRFALQTFYPLIQIPHDSRATFSYIVCFFWYREEQCSDSLSFVYFCFCYLCFPCTVIRLVTAHIVPGDSPCSCLGILQYQTSRFLNLHWMCLCVYGTLCMWLDEQSCVTHIGSEGQNILSHLFISEMKFGFSVLKRKHFSKIVCLNFQTHK